MQHMHPRLVVGEFVGELPCAVRGVVVHDENLEPVVLSEDLRNQQREILRLVVRGNDDDSALHRSDSSISGRFAAAA